MLAITCSCDQLRVDVHDTSRSLPVPADAAGDAETGRGLLLVANLATEWGFYRTPRVKPVIHDRAEPDCGDGDGRGPRGFIRGDGEPSPRRLAVPTQDPGGLLPPDPRRSPRREGTQRGFAGDVRRELTPSFFRMWETCVATVRRDSSSLAAISGLDSPSSTNAATLTSVGVRLSQPLSARRCLECGPRLMPWARNAACRGPRRRPRPGPCTPRRPGRTRPAPHRGRRRGGTRRRPPRAPSRGTADGRRRGTAPRR